MAHLVQLGRCLPWNTYAGAMFLTKKPLVQWPQAEDNNRLIAMASPNPTDQAPVFATLLAQLRAGRGHALEAAAAARALASEAVDTEAKANFLRELSEDLWTPVLLAEFARMFRSLARDPHVEAWAGRAVDVCGTGGDHSGSFNVSTATAFVVAAAKVPVFKHGNRAQTSKSGSADFLEKIGLPIEATDGVWRSALREINFAFFFAPSFHPAFAHVAPARKLLAAEGRRTIFNILGPLLNPGRPVHQLVGVFDWGRAPLLAAGLEQLGVRRGLVVHGRPPGGPGQLDELSVVCKNFATGVGELRFLDAVTLQARPFGAAEGEFPGGERPVVEFGADRLGLPSAEEAVLAGGDATRNAQILEDLLDNRAPTGLRDTVCLNAGAALWVAGRTGGLKSGVDEAQRLLKSGEVKKWLGRARDFFGEVKR
jgi:anthranilate phosphoribosyltransferase